jgi:dUTP pyrophosphatase
VVSDSIILITRLPGAEDLALPTYASESAVGLDIRAAVKTPFRLEPQRTALIPTGIAIALPPGLEAQLRPRSGLAIKHGLTILNSPATIDSDYRGEIAVVLINLGLQLFLIDRGLRIAQMVIAPVCRIVWREVRDLPPTPRGTGGFGHTGDY